MAPSTDATKWLRPQGLATRLRETFGSLTFYERFEQTIVIILTSLILVIVADATWHLGLTVLL